MSLKAALNRVLAKESENGIERNAESGLYLHHSLALDQQHG